MFLNTVYTHIKWLNLIRMKVVYTSTVYILHMPTARG